VQRSAVLIVSPCAARNNETKRQWGQSGEPERQRYRHIPGQFGLLSQQLADLAAEIARQSVCRRLPGKFVAHGVERCFGQVLRQHARRLIEQKLAKDMLDRTYPERAAQAAAYQLPPDRDAKVRAILAERLELSWDMATALVFGLG
jgi:hypothetical protein